MSALSAILVACLVVLTACAVVLVWTIWANSDAGIVARRRRALRRRRPDA